MNNVLTSYIFFVVLYNIFIFFLIFMMLLKKILHYLAQEVLKTFPILLSNYALSVKKVKLVFRLTLWIMLYYPAFCFIMHFGFIIGQQRLEGKGFWLFHTYQIPNVYNLIMMNLLQVITFCIPQSWLEIKNIWIQT